MALRNALGYVGFGNQAAFGTAVPVDKFVRWQTLDAGQEMLMGVYRSGFRRDPAIAAKMGQFAVVKLNTFLWPDMGGALLCAAMGGADTVVGTTPAVHTFGLEDCQPIPQSWEWSRGEDCDGPVLIETAFDALINSLKIQARGEQLVTVDVDVLARTGSRLASPSTVSWEADRPLSFLDGVLTFTGATIDSLDVIDYTLTLNNNVKGRYPIGNFAPRYLAEARDITYEGQVLLPNGDLYREVFFGGATGDDPDSTPSYITEIDALFSLGDTPVHSVQITVENLVIRGDRPSYDVNAGALIMPVKSTAIRQEDATVLMTAESKTDVVTPYSP